MEKKNSFGKPPDSRWVTVWCTPTNFKLQILILKQHQVFNSKFSISINFTMPLRETIPKYTQKSPQNLQSNLKHRYVG